MKLSSWVGRFFWFFGMMTCFMFVIVFLAEFVVVPVVVWIFSGNWVGENSKRIIIDIFFAFNAGLLITAFMLPVFWFREASGANFVKILKCTFFVCCVVVFLILSMPWQRKIVLQLGAWISGT
ncbi:hypothetical protein [Brachymonas sp. M4Q-1]|uniref:hypothetical protein n=1 Tax=Brachymonas sp. M4Q-1 TaxID=3416906 RepID=UPI003CEDA17F